jgi:UDP-2,4-diacetamido-2,4,6-trideoxy-beta-L-altropyranose hydrolase
MHTSTVKPEIGIVVDAGPTLGYGHAVRCMRLARALATRNRVVLYPLSEDCERFLGSSTVGALYERPRAVIDRPYSGTATPVFPPLVITDLREGHGITAAIRRQGARHISIHDLGLAQCHSDVAIDGSITRLFPFATEKTRDLFLGPQYMITREPVTRGKLNESVLVSLGGGATARFVETISNQLVGLGFTPITTRGFKGDSAPMAESELAAAMSNCSFAISGSGVTLYDLLASGVPTIAVAFDRIQLRTADAFHELGAVLSAGLMDRLTPAALMRCCKEMLENRPLVQRITAAGQVLVDGKGLSRVVDIVRRQLWLTGQMKTYTAC